MSIQTRAVLAATASILALAGGGAAFAAEPADTTSAVGLEEVVVTARRAEENLQKVPVAVTVVSQDQLTQQDVRDFISLTRLTPSLAICCGPGNTLSTSVRGVKNGAPTYFAEVPISSAGFTNFVDIRSVQVLKGPQGTLFGQASNGGAIVIEPRRPGTEFGGYVEASVGSYDRREVVGAVDVPLIADRALLRVAGQTFYRQGYVTDVSNSDRYNGQDYYIVRPSLLLNITDNLQNYTLVQYAKSKGRPFTSVLSDVNMRSVDQAMAASGGTFAACRAAGNMACVQANFNGGSPAAFNALRDQLLAAQIARGPYKIDGLSTPCAIPGDPNGLPGVAATGVTNLTYTPVACPYIRTSSYLVVNTTTWNFRPGWSLKNIASYSGGKTTNRPQDVDASRLVLLDNGSPRNNFDITTPSTNTEELQLRGELLDVVDFTLGTFHTATWSHPAITYGLSFGSQSASLAKTSSFTHAVYGQANIDLSRWIDRLTLTAGYRKTWDTVKSQTFALNPVTGAVLRVVGGPTSPAGHADFSSGSYTLQLQYQVNDETMVYLSNAKGYGSGGLQNVAGFETFQPDSLNNLEGGVKSTFRVGGMTARVNAAAYYGKYDDIKVSVNSIITNAATGVQTSALITRNAAAAKLKGIEVEATLVVTPRLEIGAFGAYNKYNYTQFQSVRQVSPGVFTPIDLSNTPFTVVPKSSWNLHATWRLPIQDAWGDLALNADFTHQGKYYNAAKPFVAQDPNNPDQTGIICSRQRTAANGYGPLSADGKTVALDCVKGHNILDVSLNWDDVMGREGLSAALVVTNVTKDLKPLGGNFQNSVAGFTAQQPGVPRMFFVRLGYEF